MYSTSRTAKGSPVFSNSTYFGVPSDGESKQLNNLINENETNGPDGEVVHIHVPDSILSMLDCTG